MIQNETYKNKKLIKVIDTPFSSFVLEKIFKNHNNFDEIIEIKKDLGETILKAKNILKISKKKLTKKEKFIITNSIAFSWSKSKISNIIKFRKIRKKIFKQIYFNKNFIYVGCKTSTSMKLFLL